MAKQMGRTAWVSHSGVLALHETLGAKQGHVLVKGCGGRPAQGFLRAGSVHHGELNGRSSPHGQNGLTPPADLVHEELCYHFPRCAAATRREDFTNAPAQKKDLSHLPPALAPKETLSKQLVGAHSLGFMWMLPMSNATSSWVCSHLGVGWHQQLGASGAPSGKKPKQKGNHAVIDAPQVQHVETQWRWRQQGRGELWKTQAW